MVCYKMDSRQVLSKDKGRSMRGMARFASLRNQSTSPCHKALMTKALCKMGFVLCSPARPRVIRKCPRSARAPPLSQFGSGAFPRQSRASLVPCEGPAQLPGVQLGPARSSVPAQGSLAKPFAEQSAIAFFQKLGRLSKHNFFRRRVAAGTASKAWQVGNAEDESRYGWPAEKLSRGLGTRDHRPGSVTTSVAEDEKGEANADRRAGAREGSTEGTRR
jgi:hypothetical protein